MRHFAMFAVAVDIPEAIASDDGAGLHLHAITELRVVVKHDARVEMAVCPYGDILPHCHAGMQTRSVTNHHIATENAARTNPDAVPQR